MGLAITWKTCCIFKTSNLFYDLSPKGSHASQKKNNNKNFRKTLCHIWDDAQFRIVWDKGLIQVACVSCLPIQNKIPVGMTSLHQSLWTNTGKEQQIHHQPLFMGRYQS
jgi:hypothetical protein